MSGDLHFEVGRLTNEGDGVKAVTDFEFHTSVGRGGTGTLYAARVEEGLTGLVRCD